MKFLCIDLRDTLIAPNRGGGEHSNTLERWGVNKSRTIGAAKNLTDRVVSKYFTDQSVADWTLVTLLELREMAIELGGNLSIPEFENVFYEIISKYTQDSKPLIPRQKFEIFIRHCLSMEMNIAIIVDGLFERETTLFKNIFSNITDTFNIQFISYDQIGINKLGKDYYKNLSQMIKIKPRRIMVIGNRLDKDVNPALKAGMNSILVGQTSKNIMHTDRFENLCPRQSNILDNALVIENFQPFTIVDQRYILRSFCRTRHLFIGIILNSCDIVCPNKLKITNPESSNLIPYWLRMECIKLALEKLGFKQKAYDMIPIAINKGKIISNLPVGLTYLYPKKSWNSDCKYEFAPKLNISIKNIFIGNSNTTNAYVIKKIRSGKQWQHLIPDIIANKYGNLIEKLITNKGKIL